MTFLEEDVLIWVHSLGKNILDVIDIDNFISNVHVVKNDFFLFSSKFIRSSTTSISTIFIIITRILRHQLLESIEDFRTLQCSEIDFSIGVKTKGNGGFFLQTFDDVVKIFIVGGGGWAFESMLLAISEWIKVEFILDKGVVHELDLISIAKSSVPIIDNVASVHNLTEEVSKIIPWDVTTLQFIDVFVQDNTGISEITESEIIT